MGKKKEAGEAKGRGKAEEERQRKEEEEEDNNDEEKNKMATKTYFTWGR